MNKVKSLFSISLIVSISLLYSCTDKKQDITPHKQATKEAARDMATQVTCDECEFRYEIDIERCYGGIPRSVDQAQTQALPSGGNCNQEAWQRYQNCLNGYEIVTNSGRNICYVNTRVDIDRFLGIPVEVNVYVTFYTVDTYTRQGGCNNNPPTTRLQKRVVGTTSASSRSVWDEDRIREKTQNAIAAKLAELAGQGYTLLLTPEEIGNDVNKCGI